MLQQLTAGAGLSTGMTNNVTKVFRSTAQHMTTCSHDRERPMLLVV